jgi:hypothetical protein
VGERYPCFLCNEPTEDLHDGGPEWTVCPRCIARVEEGERQIAAGECITLEEFEAELEASRG